MATGSNRARFVIRRATRDDLSRVNDLLGRYYTEWDVVQRDPPECVAEYLDQPAPFGFVIVEERGTLVGCVLLRALPSIASAGECKRLYVVPERRGEGLASLLMDFVEGFSVDRLEWIYLDTGANFTAAQSLYHGRGYESCERYNDNPQAACFFRKRLSR